MSGTPQYLRKISLIIGDDDEAIDFSELRIRFAVRRGDNQTPNSADIRIYNVGSSISQKVQKEFTRVVLQCGYDGNFGVIFDGTIKQVRRGRESQVDTYLDITAADGDSAYNFSVVAISLAAGKNRPKDAALCIVQGMATHSIAEGYIPDLPGNPLPRGKVIYGMARDELRKIAINADASWSIQDGKVNMVPLTAYVPGDISVISSVTGMIGLPEQTSNGVRVKVLLNPNIKIGQAIQIDNKSVQQYRYSLSYDAQGQNGILRDILKTNDDGFYYVMVADHTGDTRGQHWYTDLICLSIDATYIPGGILNRVAPPGKGYIDTVPRFP